jgi:hypothetical protein
LMEHSWICNTVVGTVESLLAKGGSWSGKRIVWAGDYAEPEPCGKCDECLKGLPCTTPEQDRSTLYSIYGTDKHTIRPDEVEYKPNGHYRYLVNEDTKEFVDLNKVPVSETWNDEDWKIHPLPLLTCEGNLRGGGDYHSDNDQNLVGSWSRNRIRVQNSKPTFKGAKELIVNFKE